MLLCTPMARNDMRVCRSLIIQTLKRCQATKLNCLKLKEFADNSLRCGKNGGKFTLKGKEEICRTKYVVTCPLLKIQAVNMK